jgi:hypothetical protein
MDTDDIESYRRKFAQGPFRALLGRGGFSFVDNSAR